LIDAKILTGDCRAILPTLEAGSVQCCVTSPPYWGLRDYGTDGQLGLEATPQEYIEKMVAVFREVKRVLKDNGSLWLNMGDGFQNKQLVGMPWRLAMSLQADGWYLRSDIIWHKPNPMPESVTDRPTKAHEYIFLLAKAERYYYDNEAIREPHAEPWRGNGEHEIDNPIFSKNRMVEGISWTPAVRQYNPAGRNKRSVWTIATQPYAEAHFATFPEEIPKFCILAGSKPGDTILDPFAGSGTVGKVALELGRCAILIELNPKYVQLIENRTSVTIGMF
jgi:DNA modification methylase